MIRLGKKLIDSLKKMYYQNKKVIHRVEKMAPLVRTLAKEA